jgi:hypothetical protein
VAGVVTASPVLSVGCCAALDQALRMMQQSSAGIVGLTDAASKLVDLITSDTIAEVMTLAVLQKDCARGTPLAWRSHSRGMQ